MEVVFAVRVRGSITPPHCASRPYSYPGELRPAAWLAVPTQLCAESICKPRISPWLGLRVPSRTRWVGETRAQKTAREMRGESSILIAPPRVRFPRPYTGRTHTRYVHTTTCCPWSLTTRLPPHSLLSFSTLARSTAVQSQKQRVRHPLGLGHVPVHTRSSASIERQD